MSSPLPESVAQTLRQASSAELLAELGRRLGVAAPEAPAAAPAPLPRHLCRPLVISGPSGVGKGTLVKLLRQAHPGEFGFSVSHTTRKPRAGEVDGVDYHFTTVDEFRAAVGRGEFVEHAEVHGNFYGTSRAAVDQIRAGRKIPVLDIDVQGSQQIRQRGALDAQYVFVAPPSLEELEARLRGRGTESEEVIARRLSNALGELRAAQGPGTYDAVLTNTRIDESLALLQALVNDNRVSCAGAGAKPFVFGVVPPAGK